MEQVGFIFYTMLSKEKSKALYEAALKVSPLEGEFWDIGCNAGGSAALMKIASPRKHIRLFDSFQGLPKETTEDMCEDDNRFPTEGKFPAAYEEIFWMLGTVHVGWVPETFKGLENSKIALAHIDLDLYQSTKDALEFVMPRIVSGGSIIVDDYGSNWIGVTKAVDECISKDFKIYQKISEQIIFVKQ